MLRKVMLRKVMVRAHEMARKMEGDYQARMSLALKLAWKEERRDDQMVENQMSKKEYWDNRQTEMTDELDRHKKLAEIDKAEDLSKYSDKDLHEYIAHYAYASKSNNYLAVKEELRKRGEKKFWNTWTKEYFQEKRAIWNEALNKYKRTIKNPNKLLRKVESETGLRFEEIKKASARYNN